MDLLKALDNFVLVVDNKSFSRASVKKYASVSTVSKQVAWLEDRLQVKLLRRSTRKLHLTEQGELVYKQAKRLLGELKSFEESLLESQENISGKLTITAPVPFSEAVLAPIIVSFQKNHPNVELTLKLTNDYIDLEKEKIDIAIRSGPIDEKRYQTHQLTQSRLGLFAAPSYCSQHSIRHLEELREHQCMVHTDFKPNNLWRFKEQSVEINPSLSANSAALLIQAAVAGHGIIYLSEYLVRNQLAEKSLVALIPEQWPEPTPIYCVHIRQANMLKKIQAFVDVLLAST